MALGTNRLSVVFLITCVYIGKPQCVEYAAVSADWARQVFHMTHCPGVGLPSDLGNLHVKPQCDKSKSV
jgi:hypothetical protein